MTDEQIEEGLEKAIKKVLKDGESYGIGEIHSAILQDAPHLLVRGYYGSLRPFLRGMVMANVIGEEQVTQYFLTGDN